MAKNQNNIIYKFAFLGDSQVGKTSIFKKMSIGDFTLNVSTIGIEKKTFFFNDIDIEIKGNKEKKSFQIEIFDTAGQERYRSLASNYIKGSDGVILIYDITKKPTFEHLKDWLASIKDILSNWNTNDYLILLLGNKLDLVEENENSREVSLKEVYDKYDNSGIILGGEVSAKNFSDKQFLDIIQNLAVNLYIKKGNNSNKGNNSTKLEKPNKIIKKKKFC